MHRSQSYLISCRSDIQYHIIGCYCSRNTQKRIKGIEYRYSYIFFVSKNVVIYQFDEGAIYTRHTEYFSQFFSHSIFILEKPNILIISSLTFLFYLKKMTSNGYSTNDPSHQSSSEFLDDKYILDLLHNSSELQFICSEISLT